METYNTVKSGQDIPKGGISMEEKLALKKGTLIAWTKILLDEGFIDIPQCNAMVQKIENLND